MYQQPPYSQQSPPARFPPCPECRGRRVQGNLSHDGEWRGFSNNGALQGFRLLICTVCGYTALYVADMQWLHRQMQKDPERFPS